MNYYLKKRIQSGFTKSDMAKALGVDYQRYVAIEKGSVMMPTNLIDKFNEIINRGKENELTKTENKIKADEFWNEVKQKNENGKYILTDKMHEFNIQNMKQLVHLLGYRSEGTVWNYLQGRNTVGDEFKKRLYNFFSDELNIQIPKQETKQETKMRNYTPRLKEVNDRLDRYYEKTDFKKLLKQYHITNKQIAAAIGVHGSVVSRMTSKSQKPSYKVIKAVKDYFKTRAAESYVKEIKSRSVAESTHSDEYISKRKLIDECNQEIETNNAKIAELQKQINEIQSKIDLATKFVDLINTL